MNIVPIMALRDNYIWCVIKQSNCLIVDPGEADPVFDFINHNKLKISAILTTHHHWDHTNGIKEIVKHNTIPVYGSEQIPMVSHIVKDKEIIHIPPLQLAFQVLTIPAHTLEHVAYYGEGLAFTGDTLFTGGCGRIFEGTAKQMYESLTKLKQLPPTTLIYCGHEYTLKNLEFAKRVEPDNLVISERIHQTQQLRVADKPTVPAPLSIELETNPFLRCEQPTVIAAASNHAGKKLTDPVEVLATLRELKNLEA